MSERETYPSERALAEAREEQAELRTHVAYPGRVQSYDAATQTADIVPLIRQQVPQPDGSYAMEEMPVIPCVPVLWPRSAGWFLAFPLRAGDTVQLLVNSSAIGHWRVGTGDVTDPGDLRRQHISHAVAIPGLYVRSKALAHAPSGDAAGLVLGDDEASGTRVTIKSDGALEITRGSTVRLRLDPDGTVHLGGAAGDQFVALANLVDARIESLRTALVTHTHPVAGAAASATAPPLLPTALPTVAAAKAKAT